MKQLYTFLLMAMFTLGAVAQERTPVPEKVKVRFFPNPASSMINFEFSKTSSETTYTLQVFNFIGKKVTEVLVTNNKTTLQLDNFFRGVYVFQLKETKTGRIIESGKFQVAK